VNLLFLHGWGFDAGFWDGLAALLPGFSPIRDDRGYFGAPLAPVVDAPCVIVAHSFGAMRALAAPPPQCCGLVAINGFDRFTAAGDAPGVPPRVVERMIARFAGEPDTVLADFRRRCGAAAASGALDAEPLAADLHALHGGDCRPQAARCAFPILSLQGGADPLLPPALREAVFAGAPRVERLSHAGGGHLLPVQDAPFCAQAVRGFAERLA
jgi:pimeloyl-[acyl-carrier protein] methyl ester esterase